MIGHHEQGRRLTARDRAPHEIAQGTVNLAAAVEDLRMRGVKQVREAVRPGEHHEQEPPGTRRHGNPGVGDRAVERGIAAEEVRGDAQ